MIRGAEVASKIETQVPYDLRTHTGARAYLLCDAARLHGRPRGDCQQYACCRVEHRCDGLRVAGFIAGCHGLYTTVRTHRPVARPGVAGRGHDGDVCTLVRLPAKHTEARSKRIRVASISRRAAKLCCRRPTRYHALFGADQAATVAVAIAA